MKKKNIYKKLMSAILSATTMFALLTMPAHAIIPGEDAYGGESHIVCYDYDTGIEVPVEVSHTNLYPDTTTYSFLDESELMQVTNEMETRTIIGNENRVKVYPTQDPYSGVVLVITLLDSNGDNIADAYIPGTGFMVSERVMLTARHCVYDAVDDILEVRVYQGVSVSHSYDGVNIMTYLDCLDPYEYDTLINSVYDTRYANTAGRERQEHDWNIGILREGFDCYYFNCGTIYNGLDGASITVTGYPDAESSDNPSQSFYMYAGQGTYTVVNDNPAFEESYREEVFFHDADTITGQSGGPVYLSNVQGSICYGIQIAGASSFNIAKGITAYIYNLLVQIISNT